MAGQAYADGRRVSRQDQQDIEDYLGIYKALKNNKRTPRRDEQINVGLTKSLILSILVILSKIFSMSVRFCVGLRFHIS